MSKGSAEAIEKVCLPETIPLDYHAVHEGYALEGYYTLACAVKRLPGHQVQKERSEAEKDLTFIGFLLFRNEIKPETIPTIRLIQQANIASIIM